MSAMEEERRHRSYTVPIIGGLFFLVTIAGGVILIVWLVSADGTKPWMPAVALVLLGIPWAFWFFAYIYTFMKLCIRRRNARANQGSGNYGQAESRRSTLPKPTTPVSNTTISTTSGDGGGSPGKSSDGNRHVQFEPVVVVHGDSNRGHNDHSGSTPESERPLTQSVG